MFVEARNWAIKIFPFPQNKKVVLRLREFLIGHLGSLELKLKEGLRNHLNAWMTYKCRFSLLNLGVLLWLGVIGR